MSLRTATLRLMRVGFPFPLGLLLLVLVLLRPAAGPAEADNPVASTRFLFKLPRKAILFDRRIWAARGRVYYALGFVDAGRRSFYHVNGRNYGPFLNRPENKPELVVRGPHWALYGRTRKGVVVIWNGRRLGPYSERPRSLVPGRGFTAKTAPGRWIIRADGREYGPYKVTRHHKDFLDDPMLTFAQDGNWTATIQVHAERNRLIDNGKDLGVYGGLVSFEKLSPAQRAFIGERNNHSYAIVDGLEYPLPTGETPIYAMRAEDRSHLAIVTISSKRTIARSFAHIRRGNGAVKILGPYKSFPWIRTGPRDALLLLDMQALKKERLFVNGRLYGEFQSVRDIRFGSRGEQWTARAGTARGDLFLTESKSYGPYHKIEAYQVLRRPRGGLSWALLIREKTGIRRVIVNGKRLGPYCAVRQSLYPHSVMPRRFIEFSSDAERWAFAAAMPLGADIQKACAVRPRRETLFMNGRPYGTYSTIRGLRFGPGDTWSFVARKFRESALLLMVNGREEGRIPLGGLLHFSILPSGDWVALETRRLPNGNHGRFVHRNGRRFGPYDAVFASAPAGKFFEASPSGRWAFAARDARSGRRLLVLDGIARPRHVLSITWLNGAKRPGYYWFEKQGRSVFLTHNP